jgi:hypothetical protein
VNAQPTIEALPADDWTPAAPGTTNCNVCRNRRVIIGIDSKVKHCPACMTVTKLNADKDGEHEW